VIAASIILYVVLGRLVLRGYRRLRQSAEAAQQRAFEGLKAYPDPSQGLVAVEFHTYYGFIAFVTQTEHRFWAPPGDAREALWRLHRFNLRWGLFAYGALLIPLLSYVNYLAQKRRIRRQEGALIV
jgi:hypothetical protein